MPANLDLDDVYVAVSEEALFAADRLAETLSIARTSPQYETFAVACGAAFKHFFELDHEMGVLARQKIVRGMIERTSASGYFEKISSHCMTRMQRDNPALYQVLHEIEQTSPDKIRKMAHMYLKEQTFDPLFLYGSWIDSTNSVEHLRDLRSVMHDLLSLQRQSLDNDFARLGYKVHNPKENTNPTKQLETVYNTLVVKEEHSALKFKNAIHPLLTNHPTVASKILHRCYCMYMPKNEFDVFFNSDQVLNDEQKNTLKTASDSLSAYWGGVNIIHLYAQNWANDIVQRSTHIMNGLGASNTVVEVEIVALDKDKIQERRAEVGETVRRSLNISN